MTALLGEGTRRWPQVLNLPLVSPHPSRLLALSPCIPGRVVLAVCALHFHSIPSAPPTPKWLWGFGFLTEAEIRVCPSVSLPTSSVSLALVLHPG